MKCLLKCSLVLLLAATGRAQADTIKIVSSFPLTGSANALTSAMVNGIRLAIDDAGGKVAGFDIEYESMDDASPERGTWDPNLVAANADKAVRDPDVMAMIGTYNSGSAKIMMPKLNLAGLAMVSPANTWPGLTKPGIGEPNEPAVYRPSGSINYVRVVPADDIQGALGAKWAKEMGATKVFIIHDRELYGKGIATIFERSAAPLGLKVVGVEGIDARAANYRSLATKIRQLTPDVIYLAGVTQSNMGQVAKDIRGSGIKAKLLVPDGCFEPAFLEAAGRANLEGSTYATFGGVPPEMLDARGKEFYAKYRQRYGVEPESYGIYAYESAQVVFEGIRRAGKKDRKAILDAILGIRNFDGVLGKWSFDQNGDTTLTSMSGYLVQDGTFKFVKSLQ